MVSVEDNRGFMSMWLQPQAEGGSEAEEAGGGKVLERLPCQASKFRLNPKHNKWAANEGF